MLFSPLGSKVDNRNRKEHQDIDIAVPDFIEVHSQTIEYLV